MAPEGRLSAGDVSVVPLRSGRGLGMALFVFFLLKGHDLVKDGRILGQTGVDDGPDPVVAEDPLAPFVVFVGNAVDVIVSAHGIGFNAGGIQNAGQNGGAAGLAGARPAGDGDDAAAVGVFVYRLRNLRLQGGKEVQGR